MNRTILIVDDESSLRSTLATILRAQGYDTLEAADGSEAVEMLDRVTPDLIFSDWRMPQLGGDAILRHVRSTPRLSSLPVIVLRPTVRATPRSKQCGSAPTIS